MHPQAIDTDDSKSVSYEEMHDGLKKMKFNPPIYLSQDDFDDMVHGKDICMHLGM